MADLLDSLNLRLPLILPALDVIIGRSILEPFEHGLILL